MSYESESVLAPSTRVGGLRDFLLLLGYKKSGVLKSEEGLRFEQFYWFDTTDYRSWTGVELSIYRNAEGRIAVSTRTPIARSYYDLSHQNGTITALKKRFGGQFRTDEGPGSYLRPEIGPPSPSASGCHLAFERFGGNLIKALLCHQARTFPGHPTHRLRELRGLELLLEYDANTC